MGKESIMIYVMIGGLVIIAVVLLVFATSAGKLNKREEEREQRK